MRSFIWATDLLGFMAVTSVSWALTTAGSGVGASPTVMLASAAALVGSGQLTGLHRSRWPIGSFDESTALASTALVATAALGLGAASLDEGPTLGRLAFVGLGTLVLMGFMRVLVRRRTDQTSRRSGSPAKSVIVFGAGTGGELAIRAMLRDVDSPYRPAAILDDDPTKHRLRIDGVPVVGGRRELQNAIDITGAETIIIAVPSANGSMISELFDLAHAHRLEVRVLPSANDLFGRQVRIADIRELRESDLLGRHRIETDINSIAGYLSGRRVLITGAGGSIGSELSRQVHRYGPSKLFLLDRDESALHAVQLSIHGRAMLDSDELVLADIREPSRLREVFESTKPDVVFHAAALKHLPLLERYPSEALQTNVQATVHLLAVSMTSGVSNFINVSS
ncbi:MAG: polysaccharide biosynthesis protein, partial [Actinobacteria bacterium]|nr:polysaccharide biosynthesis protein [Actinomycetota bacterium]